MIWTLECHKSDSKRTYGIIHKDAYGEHYKSEHLRWNIPRWMYSMSVALP